MTMQQQAYAGATARDAAAEMFAEELAEALRAQAESQGLTVSVQVCGSTLMASLAGGGCFRVTVAPSGGDH
jgi:hypothetical protein